MTNSPKYAPADFLEDSKKILTEIDRILKTLFPICRSLTGDGVRKTLFHLQSITSFNIHSVKSGTNVFDWTVPDEWEIKDAYIATTDGQRIIDFENNNIHVVNFSAPINTTLPYNELVPHLHSLPNLPEAIPYRTSYYKKNWGFCLSENQLKTMDSSKSYKVVINSSHKPGFLNYGEALLKGTSGKEFLISTYCCHPSMANDCLSGIVLWILLLKWLKSINHQHSYRFVIAPETIGAITYLWKNKDSMEKINGGYALTTAGGPDGFSYSESFLKTAIIDRAAKLAFAEYGVDFTNYPFDVTGSDERQYSSPGFRIPIGAITKSKYFEYDYYHTSLDNLDFVKAEYLSDTLAVYIRTILNLEQDYTYTSLNPHCEPMLGKRNLYPSLGGNQKQKVAAHPNQSEHLKNISMTRGDEIEAMMWVLFYSDTKQSIMDIAELTKFPVSQLFEKAELLRQQKLIKLSNKKP